MADDTDVPLHATAEPGIADSQVTETQNVIGVKEIFSCGLVPEFPETATVLRQENCFQVVIFQDCDLNILLFQLSRIAVVLPVRVSASPASKSLINFVMLIQIKFRVILQDMLSDQIRNPDQSSSFSLSQNEVPVS